MNIAVLSSRFPYPLERGDKLRLFHQIRILSKTHKIHLISLSTEEIESDYFWEVESMCASIRVILISKTELYFNILKSVFGLLPFQAGQYFSGKNQRYINKYLSEIKPDVIYCQLIRMAPFVQKSRYPVVIDLMDAFSVGMKRRASLAWFPLNLVYHIESMRLKEFEQIAANKASAVTIISHQDKDNLPKLKKKVEVVPNGIDLEYFKYQESIKEFDLVYVGNLGYLPNIQAVKILCNEIQPLYEKKFGLRLKVLLAGARPHKSLQILASDSVTLWSWIPDVRIAYRQGKILAAPIYEGTGQQNKILEAMALGVPCIATSTVNNAIGAEISKEIQIADDSESFCMQIHALLNEPSLYEHVKLGAMDFVRDHFDWDSNTERLNRIFATVKERNKK